MGTMSLGTSVTMRAILADSGTRLLSSNYLDWYGGAVTYHAISMIFLFIMVSLYGGFGNVLLPLEVGSSEVTYPRGNQSALIFIGGSSIILAMAMLGSYLQGYGWTLYPPMSTTLAGASSWVLDMMGIALVYNGLSSTLTSGNFISTYVVSAVHGSHSDSANAIYSVSISVVAGLLLAVLPVLTGAILIVTMDRHAMTSLVGMGGDSMLYIHLFWIFGHPEVYILILPAFAAVSIYITSLHSIFGSAGLLHSVLGIAGVGFVVWAHHMYQSGLSTDAVAVFASLTMMVAVPTAAKIFHWVQLL